MRECNVFSHVCQSFCPHDGRGSRWPLLGPHCIGAPPSLLPPRPWNSMNRDPPALPPARDIWWPAKTCSLAHFKILPPVQISGSFWSTVGVSVWYASYRIAFLLTIMFANLCTVNSLCTLCIPGPQVDYLPTVTFLGWLGLQTTYSDWLLTSLLHSNGLLISLSSR